MTIGLVQFENSSLIRDVDKVNSMEIEEVSDLQLNLNCILPLPVLALRKNGEAKR